MTIPADVLGITGGGWKLQYGVAGVAGIKELSPAMLSLSAGVPGYFETSSDGLWVSVRVPANAGTTDGSGYPRTELRQMTGSKVAVWDSSKLACWFEYELIPVHLPPVKGQACIFQMHSDKKDLLEVIFQRNTAGGYELTQRVDGTAKGQPVIPHDLGRPLVLGFGIVKGVPTVYRDGVSILTTTKMPQSTKTYAKALLYLQANLTTEVASEYGQILARKVRSGTGAYPGLVQPPTEPLPPVDPPPATEEPPPVVTPPVSKNITVMIIRHGEKPDSKHPGFTDIMYKTQDSHSLTANGWIRARDLYPDVFAGPKAGLVKPDVIYAADGPTAGERMKQTVSYLAPALGLSPVLKFDKGDEKDLAKALKTLVGKVALVCWEHGNIPALVTALGTTTPKMFKTWPDDRYDVVIRLDSTDSGKTWKLTQVLEAIGLPGEQKTPIK